MVVAKRLKRICKCLSGNGPAAYRVQVETGIGDPPRGVTALRNATRAILSSPAHFYRAFLFLAEIFAPTGHAHPFYLLEVVAILFRNRAWNQRLIEESAAAFPLFACIPHWPAAHQALENTRRASCDSRT
jgi:hypothetical protein